MSQETWVDTIIRHLMTWLQLYCLSEYSELDFQISARILKISIYKTLYRFFFLEKRYRIFGTTDI